MAKLVCMNCKTVLDPDYPTPEDSDGVCPKCDREFRVKAGLPDKNNGRPTMKA